MCLWSSQSGAPPWEDPHWRWPQIWQLGSRDQRVGHEAAWYNGFYHPLSRSPLFLTTQDMCSFLPWSCLLLLLSVLSPDDPKALVILICKWHQCIPLTLITPEFDFYNESFQTHLGQFDYRETSSGLCNVSCCLPVINQWIVGQLPGQKSHQLPKRHLNLAAFYLHYLS